MKKGKKKRVSVRKRWAMNPKTKVEESEKIYFRPKEKSKVKKQIGSI